MDVFLRQYFDPSVMVDNAGRVLTGFWLTVQLSLISGALALCWGLVLALVRSTRSRMFSPLRGGAVAYIDAFRGVPLLLVVLLISGSLPFLDFLPDFVRSPSFFGKPDV